MRRVVVGAVLAAAMVGVVACGGSDSSEQLVVRRLEQREAQLTPTST